jgi:sulfoxide reductase heme-binding subunit YedZ
VKSLIKSVVFILCLLPAAWLFYSIYLAFSGGENLMGPDPAQFLSLQTGEWAIRLLIASLAITPLRYLLNIPSLFRLRRMMGLYAYFYVFLHLIVFLWFLLGWDFSAVGREIAERPYITIGFAAFVLLTPLAATSFNAAQRKLGRNWKRLHRLTYACAILGCMHLIWIVRSSYFDAVLYGGLTLVFLVYRVLRKYSTTVQKFTFFPPKQRAA